MKKILIILLIFCSTALWGQSSLSLDNSNLSLSEGIGKYIISAKYIKNEIKAFPHLKLTFPKGDSLLIDGTKYPQLIEPYNSFNSRYLYWNDSIFLKISNELGSSINLYFFKYDVNNKSIEQIDSLELTKNSPSGLGCNCNLKQIEVVSDEVLLIAYYRNKSLLNYRLLKIKNDKIEIIDLASSSSLLLKEP
ncbi:MAG: hypothetical protein R2798_08090 [Chitinophagales bacterium]|nr:hypothetical protein [Bacteroidota bacterium]MCB9042394.1 hypothetical protein [Chitinophagales bacterium]